MNASTIDRLSKIMDNLAGVVYELASGSEADGAFALACAKMAAWRHVEDALRERARQDTRARNALLPVHQLPIELFAGIIEMVLAEERDAYYWKLKYLCTVSHLWQKVIDDSPSMWTRIGWSGPNRIVEEALKKSSNRLLNVSYHYHPHLTPNHLSRFFSRLDPYLNRLRSVEITYPGCRVPQDWFTDIKLFTTPQPSLEHFSLRYEYYRTNPSELTLFADQAPRLKRLQLQGVRINCHGAIFGGLSALSLSEVTVPSLKDLLSVLNRCGPLHRLELKEIWFQIVDKVESPPKRISLPFLRRLSLQEMPSTLKERLLRDVYAPQCADLAVILQADAEPQDLVTRYVPRWLSQRTPSLPEIARVAVELAEKANLLYFYDSKDSECFRLFLCHDKRASISLAILTAVNTILKAFAPKADTHLTFGQAAFALAEDQNYTDQLGFLPGVTKLGIGENWNWDHGRYWGFEGAKNFKLPAFPCLQELCFYQQPLDGIVKVVRMLLDASEVRREGGGFKVSIYVRKDSWLLDLKSTVEEVKRIVGEEPVFIRADPAVKEYEWSL